MSEKLKNLEKAVQQLNDKEYKIIFLVPDTNGAARASVAVAYNQALAMKKNGFNTVILHEKEDYMKVGAWLGDKYDELPHVSIESNNLEVSPADFLILPETFGNVVEKITHLPCQKIVYVQSLEYMLDTYQPGKSWLDYGILETMTTSPEAKQMIEELLYVTNIKTITIGIPDTFKPYTKLKKPVVAIHCKEPRKTARLLKMFYLKYPTLRWIVFRDMHGMTYDDFAKNLNECILAIWSDQTSTFPLFVAEALKCNLPIIAQIPTLLHDWTTDECASWAMTDMQIVELTAIFVKSWLEDHIPKEFENVQKLIEGKFTMAQMEESTLKVFGEYAGERVAQLNKLIDKCKEDELNEENKSETPETNEKND